jgi:hypothetical protein
MTVAHGHTTRACHCQSGGSTPSIARSTCAAASNVRSSPHSAPTHGVQVQEQLCVCDAPFTQRLMALMQPIICYVRAQSVREFVTELSGGATPHATEAVWLRARALSSRPKLTPTSPIVAKLPDDARACGWSFG